jgi:hypothetical protein
MISCGAETRRRHFLMRRYLRRYLRSVSLDRRFKIEGYPDGPGRRIGDKPQATEASGPAPARRNIDGKLKSALMG